MTSVDKAAIGWSIAIVAVAIGIALASQGMSIDSGVLTSPTIQEKSSGEPLGDVTKKVMSQQEERMEAIEKQKAMSQQEERMEAIEKQKAIVGIEEKISISEPTVEVPEMREPQTVDVSIPTGTSSPGCEETNECYLPDSVSIKAGDTVIWANDDTAAHTVTSGSPSEGPSGIFDSSLVIAGDSFEVTFDNSGSYDYFCIVHPWMTGSIQVS